MMNIFRKHLPFFSVTTDYTDKLLVNFSTSSSFFSSSSCSSVISSSASLTSSSSNSRKKFFNRQSLLISVVGLLFLCTLQIDLIRGAFEDGNNNNVKVGKQSLELTQTINMQRQEYLQQQCDALGYSMFDVNDLTEEQMEHMIVDEELKLLYCYVPKVSQEIESYKWWKL